MSEYTTGELVEYLWQLVTVSTAPREYKDIDMRKMGVVISRLRAADKLCEEAKLLEKNLDECEPMKDTGIKKAIAEYEGKE